MAEKGVKKAINEKPCDAHNGCEGKAYPISLPYDMDLYAKPALSFPVIRTATLNPSGMIPVGDIRRPAEQIHADKGRNQNVDPAEYPQLRQS